MKPHCNFWMKFHQMNMLLPYQREKIWPVEYHQRHYHSNEHNDAEVIGLLRLCQQWPLQHSSDSYKITRLITLLHCAAILTRLFSLAIRKMITKSCTAKVKEQGSESKHTLLRPFLFGRPLQLSITDD